MQMPTTAPTVKDAKPNASLKPSNNEHDRIQAIASAPRGGNYKGFVAGVFSGIAKLSVG
jgi:solute carrier family 25 (mitochondrial carnitine/acylcarnitine transporter), member 20/29